MYDEIRRGPVAIFATTPDDAERCLAFVADLGGDPDAARMFVASEPLVAVLEERDVTALVFANQDDVADVLPLLDIPAARIFNASIVQPDDATIAALLHGQPAAWRPLLAELGNLGVAAPASFMTPACTASSDVDRWTQALATAIDSGRIKVASTAKAKWQFSTWFTNGLGTSDASAYASRVRLLETNANTLARPELLARCRALRDELARLAPRDPELAGVHTRACLIYTARLLEDGAWDAAEAAAEEAFELAGARGDFDAQHVARRLRIGAWFGRLELARAFEELEAVLRPELHLPPPVLHKSFLRGLEPLEDAKRDVAYHVQAVAARGDREWRGALGKLASSLVATDAAAAKLVRAYCCAH